MKKILIILCSALLLLTGCSKAEPEQKGLLEVHERIKAMINCRKVCNAHIL